jgi:N-acetylglucosaminyldiphosphoundecaprenol N-acetyl-beta-D-mannosaminyltransferase
MLRKVNIVGIWVTSEKRKKVLEYVRDFLQKTQKKGYIVTPNPEMVVAASKDTEFKDILNKADIALADGIGLILAARVLHKPLETRVTGVDFIEDLCNLNKEKPVTMGFLGGGPGVAQKAVECLQKKYPWIAVRYISEEWNGLESGWQDNDSDVFRYSKREKQDGESSGKKNLDILFVAFGAPKQEKWIVSHLDELPVSLAMGVGGALDYLSKTVSRAPSPVRRLGLEWLYRLVHEPWRWRRQLALLTFLRLVIKVKFSNESTS